MMRTAASPLAAERPPEETSMRRNAVFPLVAFVALLAVGGLAGRPGALAQDASPAELMAARIGLAAGASIPLEASDPVGGLLLVESGEFTLSAGAPLNVTRGAGIEAAMTTAAASGDMTAPFEAVAANQEVVLGAGDAAWIPGGISGEIRNDGQERAVGIAFLVIPSGAPMTADGTPAP
jgi:hypothetical protein